MYVEPGKINSKKSGESTEEPINYAEMPELQPRGIFMRKVDLPRFLSLYVRSQGISLTTTASLEHVDSRQCHKITLKCHRGGPMSTKASSSRNRARPQLCTNCTFTVIIHARVDEPFITVQFPRGHAHNHSRQGTHAT